MKQWSDWERKDWKDIYTKYVPEVGQGETILSQSIICVSKLVYHFFNDGYIYDTTIFDSGENISNYANWLYSNIRETEKVLLRVFHLKKIDEYRKIIWRLSEIVFSNGFIEKYKDKEKTGNIYSCSGPFLNFDKDEEYIDEINDDLEE